MLKFKSVKIRYKYWTGLLALLLAITGCVSKPQQETARTNLAFLYNPSSTPLHPEFIVYHEAKSQSRLYIKVYPVELLFNQANMDNTYQARLKINYVLNIIKDELNRGVIQGISSLPSLIFSRYAKVNNDQKVSGIETHRQLIIGASHLCVGKIFTSIYPSCLSINNSPVIRLEKTEHCSNNNKKINIIDVLGFAGLPIFNKLTLNLISEAYKTNTNSIIWMVPDFRINNIEIDILRKRKRRTSEKYYNNTNVQQDLFIDSQFATIDKSLLNHDNDVFMVTYGQEVIDYIIKRFPTIKLMFWCAYKRFAHSNIESEKVNSLFPEYSKSMTSVYKDLYPQLVYKYSDNIIDIRKKCPSLKEFDREMTFDPGGHPSEKGYQLIKDLIRN